MNSIIFNTGFDSSPNIRNIKLHLRLKNKAYLSSSSVLSSVSNKTTHHNFYVVRKRFVYIIFYKNSFINITKIRSEQEIKSAILELSELLKITRRDILGTVVIDNITASGKFGKQINLLSFHQKNSLEFGTRFNITCFPGLFIKLPGLGTIILFRTGSYTIIGAKCKTNINHIFRIVQALVEQN